MADKKAAPQAAPTPAPAPAPVKTSVIDQVAEKIRTSDNVLVALSKDPSVDELSAALGLTFILDKMGKHATAIFSGAVPNAIEFLEPEKTFENPGANGYDTEMDWMHFETIEQFGSKPCFTSPYIGIYTPRDGRDHLLYDLPQTGLSLLSVIPAVRNKVNTTDLNGPSAQPHFVKGAKIYSATLHFE